MCAYVILFSGYDLGAQEDASKTRSNPSGAGGTSPKTDADKDKPKGDKEKDKEDVDSEIFEIPYTSDIKDPNAVAVVVKGQKKKDTTEPEKKPQAYVDPIDAVIGGATEARGAVVQADQLPTQTSNAAKQTNQTIRTDPTARQQQVQTRPIATSNSLEPVAPKVVVESSSGQPPRVAATPSATSVDAQPVKPLSVETSQKPAVVVNTKSIPTQPTEVVEIEAEPKVVVEAAPRVKGVDLTETASPPEPKMPSSKSKVVGTKPVPVAVEVQEESLTSSGPEMQPERVVRAEVNAVEVAKTETRGGDEASKRVEALLERHIEAPSSPVAFAPPPPLDLKDLETTVEEEKEATGLVKEAYQSSAKDGAQFYLAGKTLQLTPYERVSVDTIRRNLQVKLQGEAYKSSREGIVIANAAYDPVIAGNISYERVENFKRAEKVKRLRPEVDEEDVSLIGSIILDGQEISTQKIFVDGGFEVTTDEEFPNLRGRSNENAFFFGLTQQIRWGAVLNFGLTSTYLMTTSPKNPEQRPWTSDWNVNVTIPVPWFKDWGPYGNLEANVKLAKTTRDRAYWTFQDTINSTIVQVNLGYWDLVRSFNRLAITTQIRQNLEQLLKKTGEKLDAGAATSYEKYQVEAEVGRIQTNEQTAWSDYIQASNNLVRLLDYDRKTVIVPTLYSKQFPQDRTKDLGDALVKALDSNPSLQGSMVDVRFATIFHNLQRNQARPSLNLTMGAGFDQSNAVFGFGTLLDSYRNIINPDAREVFAALNFTIPWGNEPAVARMNQSEQALMQAEKALKQNRNNISKQVQDARVSLQTASQRVSLTKQNQDAAEKVYQTIIELWEKGQIPPLAQGQSNPAFEILSKNNDLLSARLAHIDAKIDFKKAEEALLSAIGILATKLPGELHVNLTIPSVTTITNTKAPAAETEAKPAGEAPKPAEAKKEGAP